MGAAVGCGWARSEVPEPVAGRLVAFADASSDASSDAFGFRCVFAFADGDAGAWCCGPVGPTKWAGRRPVIRTAAPR